LALLPPSQKQLNLAAKAAKSAKEIKKINIIKTTNYNFPIGRQRAYLSAISFPISPVLKFFLGVLGGLGGSFSF
jgi:hypothetical protein